MLDLRIFVIIAVKTKEDLDIVDNIGGQGEALVALFERGVCIVILRRILSLRKGGRFEPPAHLDNE